VLCCNPPYVRRGDPHLQEGDLPREPAAALVAGATGLEAIHAVVQGAAAHLHPGGALILEHGYDQGEQALACLAAQGFTDVRGHADIAGHQRVATARSPAA
jgi:release factor glutamine methyltransferase